MILHTEKSREGETIIFLHTALQTGGTELAEQTLIFVEISGDFTGFMWSWEIRFGSVCGLF